MRAHPGRPGGRRTLVILAAVAALSSPLISTDVATAVPTAAATLPYQDPALPVATRVSDLLGRMTLADKVGQMTQAERGDLGATSDLTRYRIGALLSGGGSAPSPNTPAGWADMYDTFQRAALATPLGIPMIYGVDAVHGHNNVPGATIFPHNIGLGATRDPALVQRIGRATAEEVSGTGIDWDFAPCLCVARDDRWGRTYESFGEKPELVSSMATVITGLQGTSLNGPASVLATAKHYLGDGGTSGGKDQGDTQLSEAELRAIHLPPFREAIARHVGSVMVSYSSVNGQKMHGNSYLINSVLKGELGFTGFVVSDWAAIDQLDGQKGFTGAEVSTAVNAGLDMAMVPNDYLQFITLLTAEVQAGRIPMSRIDDANRRILTKKFELGLFEKPFTDRSYTSTIGSVAHRVIAREAVRKSQVLLKNNAGVLPIPKAGGRIFVAGKNADDIGNQSGGWTVTWQGASGNTTPGTTILQGIRASADAGSTVTYSRDGSGITGGYTRAIAVVGEKPYAEGAGDRPTGLSLDAEDLTTISRLKASGVPTVVVLVSGRPLDIASQLPGWDALLASWLPGTEGQGVADVLFGDYNPTGKLPYTWMQSFGQQPINDGDGKPALFPYGFGLSYGPTPTPTVTLTPTVTPTQTPTATQTPAPTPTATVAPTATPSSTPTPTAGGCTATLKTLNSWAGGFQAEVTITAGQAPIRAWTARWPLAAGQGISSLWSGKLSTQAASSPFRMSITTDRWVPAGWRPSGSPPPGRPAPRPSPVRPTEHRAGAGTTR